MEQNRQGQYDDDLTVDIDEYDEDLDAGGVDLFEYTGDDESPLARLKEIILSIDWEINDDILRQFNEELLDLKDVWAGDKVNLIYVQALQKLSRYIYKEKADAHPNTINLLLAFYANLEKIVSSGTLSDQEKKSLLIEDVQRFEKLKKLIGRKPESSSDQPATEIDIPVPQEKPETAAPIAVESDYSESPADMEFGSIDEINPLLNLKAIVYGMDWEITERDLAKLSEEVKLLEKKYQSSKAKMIFLQGLGSLGSYINLKRSNAHADAFKLLHSFFIGLETVVVNKLSGQDEKNILMPEVKKFNSFKATVAETLSSEAIARESTRAEEPIAEQQDEVIQPAFADVSEDVHGFREDEELAAIKEKEDSSLDEGDAVVDFATDEEKSDQKIASEMESRLSGMFTEPGREEISKLDSELALQGVDVESDADDDSEEEPLLVKGGELAPALASEEDDIAIEDSPAVLTDDALDDFFPEPDSTTTVADDSALPGVDVETEADDDSGEEPLAFEDGDYSPALAIDGDEDLDDSDVSSIEGKKEVPDVEEHIDNFFDDSSDDEIAEIEPVVEEEAVDPDTQSTSEIEDRFDNFFGAEEATPSFKHVDNALQGVDVETEADDDSDEEPLKTVAGELSPALGGEEVDSSKIEEPVAEFDDFHMPEDDADDSVEEEDLLSVDADFADELEDEELSFEDEEFALDSASGDDEPEDEEFTLEPASDDDKPEDEELSFEESEHPSGGGDDLITEKDESLELDIESEGVVAEQFDAFFGADEDSVDEEDIQDTASVEEVSFEEPESEDELEETLEFEESALEESALEETEFDGNWDKEIDAVTAESSEEIVDDSDLVADDDKDLSSEDLDDELSDFLSHENEDLDLLESDTETVSSAFIPEEESSDELQFDEIDEIDDVEEISAEDVIVVPDDDVVLEEEDSDDYQSSSSLLNEFNRIAGDDDSLVLTHPSDNEDFIVSIEKPESPIGLEEEVVFEPADETDETEDVTPGLGEVDDFAMEYTDQPGDESIDFEVSDAFGTELLSDESLTAKVSDQQAISDLALESVDEELTEDQEGDGPELVLEEEDSEDLAYVDQQYVDQQLDASAQDDLSDLRSGIISLGLEIDDAILGSLTKEIEKLRHAWMSKPLEKSFLQLLETVVQHIDNYRYEADPQANKLLLSIFDKLELSGLKETDSSDTQEALLIETSKVLQWQQQLINRKTSDTETAQDSSDHTSDAFLEQSDLSEKEGEETLLGVTTDNDSSGSLAEVELVSKVSSMMKNELEQLKNAFRSEMKELKDEMMRKDKRE